MDGKTGKKNRRHYGDMSIVFMPAVAFLLILAVMVGCSPVSSGPSGSAVTEGSSQTSPESSEPSLETVVSGAETDGSEATTTESSADASSEATTEPPTEPPTEPSTEPPTQAPTEPSTEPPTQAPTEPPTEPPTQAPTEAPTEPHVVGTATKDAPLSDYWIVTTAQNTALADTLVTAIAMKYHVVLPVVEAERFSGTGAIYLGVDDFNSYGGYRYGIRVDPQTASVHLMGSGTSLKAAVSHWINNGLSNAENSFPFGAEDGLVDYSWGKTDVQYTNHGIKLLSTEIRELAEGVALHTLHYQTAEGEQIDFFAVVVKANSKATMMAVAAPWDGSNSVNNPVKLYTVQEYGDQLRDQGYQVLAISNGGFFKKSAGSNLPHGVQIIAGEVLKAPDTSNTNYTDNWLGVTNDGKYVISNTKGYSQYKGKIQYALGGGKLLMKNGVPCFSSGDPAFRTCAGLSSDGDLVILTARQANYAMAVQAFMDLDIDIVTVLNLDGGGSTTLHIADENGDLHQYLCGNGNKERPVADALSIVLCK